MPIPALDGICIIDVRIKKGKLSPRRQERKERKTSDYVVLGALGVFARDLSFSHTKINNLRKPTPPKQPLQLRRLDLRIPSVKAVRRCR
jgi:hypothetical protein